MDPPAYFKNVYRYVESDGWSLSTKQVDEGTYLIRGRQQTDEGDRTLIVLIVTGADRQVTPKHLEYAYTVGTETNANRVVVTAEGGVEDAATRLAEEHGIGTLPPSSVPSPAADRSDTGPGSDTDDSEASGVTAGISRRRLVASGSVLAGGVLTSGYLVTTAVGSETTFTKSGAATIQPEELRSNIDQYVGSSVHYSPATVAQVIEPDTGGYQLRIQVTQTGGGEATLFGRWRGNRYDQGARVELWGIVSGTVTYETEFGAERTVPSIDIRDMSAL